MERNFNIDKYDLYSLLDLLKMYQADSDVLEDRFKLERIIGRFENHFCEEKDDSENLDSLIAADLNRYKFFKPLYPLVNEFLSTEFGEEVHFEPNYTVWDISDNEAYSTVGDFFREQGEFFSDGFSEFDEEADNHLKFIDKTNDTDGEMIFLKSTGDAYIFCPNYSDITKLTILSHELEHVIDCFKNPLFYENFLIRETVAIFMEMVFGDFCARKYKLVDDHLQRKYALHCILKSHARIFVDKYEMLELIEQNKNLSKDELLALLNNYGFDISCIEFLMENTITEDSFYILAYLISLEVYFIYYKNKDKALMILKDIILNGTDNNILDIISKYGIILNSNLSNYEEKVLGKVKKQ